MEVKTKDTAVPCVEEQSKKSGEYFHHPDMSLRDWFAGMALHGQLVAIGNQRDPKVRAVAAYEFADAMLAERAKERK